MNRLSQAGVNEVCYVESAQSSTTNPDPNPSKKVRIRIGSLLRRGSNPAPICTEILGLGLAIGAKRGQSGQTKTLDEVSLFLCMNILQCKVDCSLLSSYLGGPWHQSGNKKTRLTPLDQQRGLTLLKGG
jgi:hypothetical protein